MKQITLLIISLCVVLALQAQVSKTLEVSSGNLDSLLSPSELLTITDLTLTGTMDARDFKTMRDDMPLLEALDIREVTINAYEGYDGTFYMPDINNLYSIYKADEIPQSSFSGKGSLKTILFPMSCKSIGAAAFSLCKGLTGELHLPPALNKIDFNAFILCTGFTGDLIIPPLVTIIESYSFNGCSGFTSLTLPPSVREIKYDAFSNCSGLQFIDAQSPSPIPLTDEQSIFNNIDKTSCILRVPYATRELYASAPVWKEFTHIIEHEQGFLLSATSLRFEKEGGTNNSIGIEANVGWSAHSDQQWISVSPSSGVSDQSLSITVEANPTIDGRQGTITFSSEGINSQLIHVTQVGISTTISITPGGLSDALTAAEKGMLSYLTLTGSMDARDFKTIHDEMPLLEILDISGTTIEAFTDTTFGNHILRPANTIPAAIWEWTDEFQTDYSLSEHPRLSVVKLPASLKTIGYRAFFACTGLTTVEMQSSVEKIGNEAFFLCSSLTSINLPTSVTDIGEKAFGKCVSLSSIELPSALTAISPSTFAECNSLISIDIPESVTAIGDNAFYGCSELQSIVIPPLVTSIEPAVFSNCNSLTSVVMPPVITAIKYEAFKNCSSLTSIAIPKSVTFIGHAVFWGCKNLQSIYSYPDPPVDLLDTDSWGVFENIDKSGCTLYVPFGAKALYANSYGWKDFSNIVEMVEFTLSPDAITLEPAQTSAAVEVTTPAEWTVNSDQAWLSVTPVSGLGNTILTMIASVNTSVDQRTARVIFHTNTGTSPNIIVTQKGIPVTVELTPGGLSAEFPTTELRNVNTLVLTGSMDARDFKFIRDHLPFVTELDLREVTIVAYSGNEGTYHTEYYQEEFYDYPANELPPSAFEGYSNHLRIDFPSTLNSIGARAFYRCSKLTDITIPSSVTSIGASAFALCFNMTNINLPPYLTAIEDNLFEACSHLTLLTIPSTVTSIGKSAFAVCDRLTFLEIPSSVTSIGERAFESCRRLNTVILPAYLDSIKDELFNSSGLTTISIPASVRYIGTGAFRACYLLTEMYSYAVNPPELAASEVFAYFDKTTCTLFVPYGSKEKYAAADQWKDFTHIVEMDEFDLSATTALLEAGEGSNAVIQITGNAECTALSDQPWLQVTQRNENGQQTLHLTAHANPDPETRTATVTVSAPGIEPKTITVTQQGITVEVQEMAADAKIKYYPNPFTREMTIEISNPLRREVLVDIYSISGQKIKSLIRAQNEAKISLTWDGSNEQGMQVLPGIYLCKVNGQVVKVVKR